tara:strand:- start:3720 stop:4112 length:393 start_codon:yes stop_codon:yes gene_type:complete
MKKSYQQYVNDYAERAIANGMDPNQAWAEAANQADQALLKGWIEGSEAEMAAANDRAGAFGVEKLDITGLQNDAELATVEDRAEPYRPTSMEDMRSHAAERALAPAPEPLTVPPQAKKKPGDDEASLTEE